MSHWSRQETDGVAQYFDERWTALCGEHEIAKLLIRFDHHTVWIKGRRALLLTYPWLSVPEEEWPAFLPISVSFTYAKGHPAAPAAAQEAVDRLSFASDQTQNECSDE